VELSCVVAPIYDHQGQLVAALDIAYYGKAMVEGLINLLTFAVKEAAWQIEAANFGHAYAGARLLSVPDANRGCVGLLAVDADDIVLGATRTARLTLGLAEAAIRKGVPAGDLQPRAVDFVDTIANAERGTVRRALARAGGNISASAKALSVSRSTMKRKVGQYKIAQIK
jgi:transcriptional regulator of acetoin/glycerol metabolism